MTNKTSFNLKLLALNHDDLKVLSAHLQDSVTLVKDIIFLKKSRTFLMMVNRFMWEDVERGIFRENKRIRSAVKFENVLEVKSRNINQKKKDKNKHRHLKSSKIYRIGGHVPGIGTPRKEKRTWEL